MTRMLRRVSATMLIAATTVSLPRAASAAEAEDIAPFEECGAITDSVRRLACFDAALASARAGWKERSARRQRRAVEDFGLSAPQLAERAREEAGSGAAPVAVEQQEPEQVQSLLQEVFTDGNGKKVFLLANGQVWRETTGSSYSGILRNGWTAHVRKGGIGGYRLSFDDRIGFFKVQRVR